MRRKYIRPLFAAGLDLAARSGPSFLQPDFFALRDRLLRLTLATELIILRSFSLMLGVEEAFMAFYRCAENCARRVPGDERPDAS
jgi:hypothetical protein